MKKSITLILLLISSYIPMNSQTVFTHPWQGKRVAYFGDSITDPKNSGSKKKFWGFLNEWLGITPYVYGISGRQWNDIPNQTRKLKEQHGDDVDAILIFVGTNDFNHSIPLGEWFEEKEVQVEAAEGQPKALETRVMRTYKMDKNTYRGRINIAMSLLKKMYPTKQIVLLTPLHRAYACFGDIKVSLPADNYLECAEQYKYESYNKSDRQKGCAGICYAEYSRAYHRDARDHHQCSHCFLLRNPLYTTTKIPALARAGIFAHLCRSYRL